MDKTTINYRVPYADTDQMGVVYYANYLEYFERARNELLRAIHFTYLEMESLGMGLPVVEAHCRYLSSARYDDLLSITAWFGEVGGSRVRVECDVRRGGQRLAEGYTVHACTSLETGRPIRLPEKMRAAIITDARS